MLLVAAVVWTARAIAWIRMALTQARPKAGVSAARVLVAVQELGSRLRAAWTSMRPRLPVWLASLRRRSRVAAHRGAMASATAGRGSVIAARVTMARAEAITVGVGVVVHHQLEEGAAARPSQPVARDSEGRRLRASLWAQSRFPAKAAAVANSRLHRLVAIVASVATVTAVLAGAFVAGTGVSVDYTAQLPDVHELTTNPLPEDSQIFAADGSQLADIHDPSGAQHYDQALGTMGKWLPAATVAIEDAKFWQEPAISPAGVIRAAYLDWRNRNTRQGGSTITQQLVKLRLTGGSRTYDRKIKEGVLAFEVEGTYSKKQVLEMYLNAAPYGNNAQGSLAAARNYFGKETNDLDLAEAAMLAGIPQSPVYNSPLTNWNGAKVRQSEVLQAMVRNQVITSQQAEQAEAENLKPLLRQPSPSIRAAPAFTGWVIQKMVAQFGHQAAYTGGLKVTTTVSPLLQALAEQAVVNNVNGNLSKGMSQGAMVAIDPRTGAVQAMVGSADPNRPGGQYNLAVWPPRNPGSSFKIFTYTAAIASQKFTMSTHIRDAPLTVAAAGSGAWQPKNYDGKYHGTCQVQQCMGNSLNVPAVEVELSTGVDQVVQMARKMGAPPYMPQADGTYSAAAPATSYGPSLTLGGYPETPLQMASGAATLASGGVYHPAYGIAQVADRHGAVVFTQNVQGQAQQVVDPRVAYIMQSIMSDDSNRQMIFGKGSALTLPGRHVGAKTGTTEDFKDAWTLGYTPTLASAFWFGNPNSTPMATGWDAIFAAAPGWHNFMQAALDSTHTPDLWYNPPPGLGTGSADGKQVWLMPGTSANQPTPPLPPNASLH
jgi:membrane peptidoglycan carboxypeptidase